MKYNYFYNNQIISFENELTVENGFELGITYADSIKGIWLPFNEEQNMFYQINSTASAREVFNMKLDIILEPTPIPESELIENARRLKLESIQQQDKNTENFTVNGVSMWLDKNTRTSIVSNTLPAEKLSGKTHTSLWYDGQPPIEIILPIEWLENKLSELELYAKATYDTTQKHIANVYKLNTVEDIESYDEMIGYPEKKIFEYGDAK